MTDTEKKVPAIIFGDFIAAFGAIRGLSRHGIPIYIVSKTATGLATKSRFVRGALALEPKDSEFINKLNEWVGCEVGEDAVLMVAGDDDYLDVLSQKRQELGSGMRPTFPDWEVTKLVREKRYTYEIADSLGIPVPKTHHIACRADLESLLDSDEHLDFPILMKPEDSAKFLKQYGNKGIVCEGRDELLSNYDTHEGFHGSLLLQDLIPGEESRLVSSLVTLNQKSQPTGLLINYKKRSEGQFLSCSLVATTWSDQLLDYSLKLLREIGYYGYAGTQFKLDPRDDKFKLMEINGRITMSNSLALKCGINLPHLMYREALHGPLPALENFKQDYPDDVLWWYLVGDIASIWRNKLYLTPFAYIRSVIGRSYTIEPMSWRDPYPGLLSIIGLFRGAWRRIFRLN